MARPDLPESHEARRVPVLHYAPVRKPGEPTDFRIAGAAALHFVIFALPFGALGALCELHVLRRFPVEDGNIFPFALLASLPTGAALVLVSCLNQDGLSALRAARWRGFVGAAVFVIAQLILFILCIWGGGWAIGATVIWVFASPLAGAKLLLKRTRWKGAGGTTSNLNSQSFEEEK